MNYSTLGLQKKLVLLTLRNFEGSGPRPIPNHHFDVNNKGPLYETLSQVGLRISGGIEAAR